MSGDLGPGRPRGEVERGQPARFRRRQEEAARGTYRRLGRLRNLAEGQAQTGGEDVEAVGTGDEFHDVVARGADGHLHDHQILVGACAELQVDDAGGEVQGLHDARTQLFRGLAQQGPVGAVAGFVEQLDEVRRAAGLLAGQVGEQDAALMHQRLHAVLLALHVLLDQQGALALAPGHHVVPLRGARDPLHALAALQRHGFHHDGQPGERPLPLVRQPQCVPVAGLRQARALELGALERLVAGDGRGVETGARQSEAVLHHRRGHDVGLRERPHGVRSEPAGQGHGRGQPALVPGRGHLRHRFEVHDARETPGQGRVPGGRLDDAHPQARRLGRAQIALGHHTRADQENGLLLSRVCHGALRIRVCRGGARRRRVSRVRRACGSRWRPTRRRGAGLPGRPASVRPTGESGRPCPPAAAAARPSRRRRR